MSDKSMRALLLERLREEAAALDVSLQEYILLCILDKLDDK